MSYGVKVWNRGWSNSLAFSVSETIHELSSLRKGEEVETVFRIFLSLSKDKKYELLNFGYIVDK